ncbi:unnamed protein product, partial [Amoebophrya sp. A120]|eukprot:GSA120T00009328001.1
MKYPFPHREVAGRIIDAKFPGTACQRLASVLERVANLEQTQLDADWASVTRKALLLAGGLKSELYETSHAFNDDNHCDLTTMLGNVMHEENASGLVKAISRQNQLGPHIQKASIPELGEGGSWSTCTNGCHVLPSPEDVAHVQFQSRVAFKLVWVPPEFKSFVLLDDDGKVLRKGTPTGQLPHISARKKNFELVRGGISGNQHTPTWPILCRGP